MNYGPLVFLAAFMALSASWFGLVSMPQIQIGREQPGTNIVNTAEAYPQGRPGLARQGLEVYRANGCAYCHSQQVGQTGTEVNVLLLSTGTNPVAVAEAVIKAGIGITNANTLGLSAGLPKAIRRDVSVSDAKAAVKAIAEAGGDARMEILPLGPDIARGWGKRRSVAKDFLYDATVMLGAERIGPDLANVGVRLPDANWHLRHLYAPKLEVKDSPMPSYRFLFEQRKIQWHPSPDALTSLPKELAPPAGYEIVPKPEAKALVAYLMSLRADVPLFEAPFTVVSAPAASTATNSPPK
jgi:cbb3-type cytochrome oxidase cytochrome c subunit